MAGKRKPLPAAPRADVTLRTFDQADWRWPIPEGTKVYMKRRVSVGMPEELRKAIEEASATSGLSMSEIGRRCFRVSVVKSVKPRGL